MQLMQLQLMMTMNRLHHTATPSHQINVKKIRTIDLEGTNVPKTSGNVFVSQKGLKIKSVFEDLW